MSTSLAKIEAVPALIAQGRADLAYIITPAEAHTETRRAAAIADLSKRAKLPVPIQSEAALYRAEALQRLAALVDEGQARGEIAGKGQPKKSLESGDYSPQTLDAVGTTSQAVAEGRLIAKTGAVEKVRAALDGAAAAEEELLVTHETILRTARSGEVGSLKTSDSQEWYTPAVYLDAVRKVLGDIDLDPASCAQANRTIGAARFFTEEQDGLSKRWAGRVFMNPPYGGAQAPFVAKLIEEYEAGNVTEAIALVSAYSTDTQWFKPLWDGTLCFLEGRIKWDNPTGKASSATIGSVFVYLGTKQRTFVKAFEQFGPVVARV